MKNDLFKIAYDFLKNEQLEGLYLAYDTEDKLICFGGNPDEPYYGCRSVVVSKEDGSCKWFVIGIDEEKEKILDEAEEVAIPSEYTYKEE